MDCLLLFCHFAQPENDIFGAFSSNVKSGYRFFIPPLHEYDTAQKAWPKALPPFCAGMVAAGAAVRYNKAVPKENKENICRKRYPALQSGRTAGHNMFGGNKDEKDHSPFVYRCLWCGRCRYGSDRLRRFRIFHRGILCCREHCIFCRC